MKEAKAVAEKMIPPPLIKKTVNNNIDTKQTATQETEGAPANQDKSPPKKRKAPSKPATSILDSADLSEAAAAGGVAEISLLYSKFAEVLSERAAADTSQMNELEGILIEAQSLQSYLKEKKKHLRQTLDLISDKLQG